MSRIVSVFIAVAGVFLAAGAALATEQAPVDPGLEKLATFFHTKWGQYFLIFIFFSFIILYLRTLFGPRGLFRDKRWDELNEEMRQKEALLREEHLAREIQLGQQGVGAYDFPRTGASSRVGDAAGDKSTPDAKSAAGGPDPQKKAAGVTGNGA
ncbi:hypothetical protein [Desulfovibrio psychrotolerans]|uniref:Uncharacterized protein n=1 Tax=Desulfovibrio psychrotolerans TaxID=415242 RepID=A0A7J0BWK5_9BACT|nr:hypothetical protein [Desulfovibrio psychrotolerans]GFM37545.1 hypothetical protein DSM19430T_22290 [Desulfovibrio psychrotolerans]